MAKKCKPPRITQSSKAKAVMQDFASYKETLLLLKILALGNCEVDEGRIRPLATVVRRLRGSYNT